MLTISRDAADAPEDSLTESIEAEALTAVDITLGQERQPERPIEIRFPTQSSDYDAFFVLSQSSSSGEWEAIPSRVEGDQLVATTEHLSTFVLFGFDIGGFVDDLLDGGSELIGLTYPEPDCDSPVSFEGETYAATASGPGAGQAYMCVSVEGGQLLAEAHSNSPLTWTVDVGDGGQALVPKATLEPSAIVTSAMRGFLGEGSSRRTVMAPGSTARVAIDPDSVPVELSLSVNPLLDAIGASVVLVAEGLGNKWDPAAAVPIGQCLAKTVDLSVQEPDAQWLAQLLYTTTDCAVTVLRELGVKGLAVVAGVLFAVAPVLAGRMLSILVTQSGMDRMTMTVDNAGVRPHSEASKDTRVSDAGYAGFLTPSANIACQVVDGQGEGTYVGCAIQEKDYVVSQRDAAREACFEDVVAQGGDYLNQVNMWVTEDNVEVSWACQTDSIYPTARLGRVC